MNKNYQLPWITDLKQLSLFFEKQQRLTLAKLMPILDKLLTFSKTSLSIINYFIY